MPPCKALTFSIINLHFAFLITRSHISFKFFYSPFRVDKIEINIFDGIRRPRYCGQQRNCTSTSRCSNGLWIKSHFRLYKFPKCFGFTQPVVTAYNIEPSLQTRRLGMRQSGHKRIGIRIIQIHSQSSKIRYRPRKPSLLMNVLVEIGLYEKKS
jgi:hypothetical protein